MHVVSRKALRRSWEQHTDIQDHWASIRPLLVVRNEREYDRAVKRLNRMLDEIATDERHPLYGLLDTFGTLIHAYEEAHCALPQTRGADMLRFLLHVSSTLVSRHV